MHGITFLDTVVILASAILIIWSIWRAAHMSATTSIFDVIAIALTGIGGAANMFYAFMDTEPPKLVHAFALSGLALWVLMPMLRESIARARNSLQRWHL